MWPDIVHTLSFPTLLPLIGAVPPSVTVHNVLLFCPPTSQTHYAARFHPLFQDVYLHLLSSLLDCHLTCHSVPTTPLGVIPNPTLFCCLFLSSSFHLVSSISCPSTLSDSCLRRCSALRWQLWGVPPTHARTADLGGSLWPLPWLMPLQGKKQEPLPAWPTYIFLHTLCVRTHLMMDKPGCSCTLIRFLPSLHNAAEEGVKNSKGRSSGFTHFSSLNDQTCRVGHIWKVYMLASVR